MPISAFEQILIPPGRTLATVTIGQIPLAPISSLMEFPEGALVPQLPHIIISSVRASATTIAQAIGGYAGGGPTANREYAGDIGEVILYSASLTEINVSLTKLT